MDWQAFVCCCDKKVSEVLQCLPFPDVCPFQMPSVVPAELPHQGRHCQLPAAIKDIVPSSVRTYVVFF